MKKRVFYAAVIISVIAGMILSAVPVFAETEQEDTDTIRVILDYGEGHEGFVEEYYSEGGSYTTSGMFEYEGSRVFTTVERGSSKKEAAEAISNVFPFRDLDFGFMYKGEKLVVGPPANAEAD